MKIRYRYPMLALVALAVVLVAVFAKTRAYQTTGTTSTNPNYPKPQSVLFRGQD